MPASGARATGVREDLREIELPPGYYHTPPPERAAPPPPQAAPHGPVLGPIVSRGLSPCLVDVLKSRAHAQSQWREYIAAAQDASGRPPPPLYSNERRKQDAARGAIPEGVATARRPSIVAKETLAKVAREAGVASAVADAIRLENNHFGLVEASDRAIVGNILGRASAIKAEVALEGGRASRHVRLASE